MTPPTFTDDADELVELLDLRDVWPGLVGPQGRNRQWPCPNPHHAQTGTTPPVAIDPTGTLWHCHGCDAGGRIYDAVMLAYGDTFADAIDRVRGMLGRAARPARTERVTPRRIHRDVTPPALLNPSTGVVDDPDEAAAIMGFYLDARQWRPETVEAFGLVAVRDHRGNARVRHPYRVNGITKWYQDRAVHPDVTPKWDSPKGHPRVCYARDLAATIAAARDVDYPRPALFLAEGPADVVALWHAQPTTPAIGIPGTGGAAKWALRLRGFAVLIVTDADAAGDRAATELAAALHRVDAQAARIRPPDGMDLDDWRRSVGDAAFRETLLESAEGVNW